MLITVRHGRLSATEGLEMMKSIDERRVPPLPESNRPSWGIHSFQIGFSPVKGVYRFKVRKSSGRSNARCDQRVTAV